MSERDSLPDKWELTTLDEVVAPLRISVHPTERPELPYIGMEHVEPETMRLIGTGSTNEMKSSARFFRPGDVLYGRLRPYLNKVYRPNFEGLCSAEFIVLPGSSGVDNRYLQYFLNSWSFKGFASHLNTGDRPRVDWDQLKGCAFHLPPLFEQRRIVAAIEEQFSRLEASISALERVRANLKHYRTSVLKAAVEGRLTESWREENPDVEPASELLERMLEERREQWERDQFASYEKKGKKPPKNWRSKYKEPAEPNIENLLRLPEGWRWINLDTVLSGITAGKSFRCEERPPEPDEVGVVKVSAVSWGEFDELESKTNTDLDRYNPDLLIHEGDFLFSRANTLALVGACVIVRHVRSSLMLSDKILRFRIVRIPSSWLLLALRTRNGRNEIERLTTGNQNSMRNISQENIRRIRIPLPPLREQEKIIAEVERRLSILQEVEAEVAANLKRASRLRQAILKRAFEGKLVPQDPSDEPASELLKRIWRDREKASSKKPKRRAQKRATGRIYPAGHAGTLF